MATTQELKDRLKRLEDKLTLAEDMYDRMIETGLAQEYHYNDGQNIIKMIYRTPEQLTNFMEELQRQINKVIHKLYGRTTVLRDTNSRRY